MCMCLTGAGLAVLLGAAELNRLAAGVPLGATISKAAAMRFSLPGSVDDEGAGAALEKSPPVGGAAALPNAPIPPRVPAAGAGAEEAPNKPPPAGVAALPKRPPPVNDPPSDVAAVLAAGDGKALNIPPPGAVEESPNNPPPAGADAVAGVLNSPPLMAGAAGSDEEAPNSPPLAAGAANNPPLAALPPAPPKRLPSPVLAALSPNRPPCFAAPAFGVRFAFPFVLEEEPALKLIPFKTASTSEGMRQRYGVTNQRPCREPCIPRGSSFTDTIEH